MTDASTKPSKDLLDGPRPWAFTQAELLAGLRRITGDPTLGIRVLREREITQRLPSVGRLRGLHVEAEGSLGKHNFDLVLKETQGSTRTGAAGAGLREASIYLYLKDVLPVRMPVLVAAHPKGEWLIMVHLPTGRFPERWQAADYLLATDQLAILHDRFWGLGEDLATYSWLENPLDSTRDIYIQAAKAAARTLSQDASRLLSKETNIPAITDKIIANLDTIIATLRGTPMTLLHGDYWPGNIHIHPNTGITVFDWEDSSIGPGVLDLLSFIQASSWNYSPLPISADELIAYYRNRLAQAGAYKYKDDEWVQVWDYAVMWTFVVGWVNNLARTPDSILSARLPALEEVLFAPLRQAVERRIP